MSYIKKFVLLTIFLFLPAVLLFSPKNTYASCLVTCAAQGQESLHCSYIGDVYCGSAVTDPNSTVTTTCLQGPTNHMILCCATTSQCNQTCTVEYQSCSSMACCSGSFLNCNSGYCSLNIPTVTPLPTQPPLPTGSGNTGPLDLAALQHISTPSLGNNFTVGTLINQLLLYFIPFSGLILLLLLIYGGYKIMFSGGQPAKINEGKDIIVGALIGFTIIFVAYFLIQLVGTIFGITIFGTIFHP